MAEDFNLDDDDLFNEPVDNSDLESEDYQFDQFNDGDNNLIMDKEEEDLKLLDSLLREGLERPRPKHKMNPKSLENLRRGGIVENIKQDKIEKRKEDISARLERMRQDPVGYTRDMLMENFIKEQMNLEEMHDEYAKTEIISNQAKIRDMMFKAYQSVNILADSLKAQPKQHQDGDKASVANKANAFEEFRKTMDPSTANSSELLAAKLEEEREAMRKALEEGEID